MQFDDVAELVTFAIAMVQVKIHRQAIRDQIDRLDAFECLAYRTFGNLHFAVALSSCVVRRILKFISVVSNIRVGW